MNRAISGDDVIIKVLDQDLWEKPKNIIVSPEELVVPGQGKSEANTQKSTRSPEEASEMELEMDLNIVEAQTSKGAIMPTAIVVAISERNHSTFCGSLEETTQDSGNIFFLPVNRCIPRVFVNLKDIQSLMSKRIMVTIDSWPVDSRHPLGHLSSVVGEIGDAQAETNVILTEYDIQHGPWSKKVEECLPGDNYTIDEKECEGRVDLRKINVCSIDPPGCTDIDDALHCTRLPNGEYEVGVHIADVTHYVKPGSALDQEAAKRSTSVYLVDRRIDMIPARLSTDICSLHQHVDRLAFSCVWRLSKDADILETRFFKSVINSKAAFSYAEAQQRIDLVEEGTDPLTWACKDLMYLARCLKQKRTNHGALTLASSEVQFKLTEDRKNVCSLGAYKLKEANSLVEEFMLLANVSVATYIKSAYSTFALLRRHPTPAPEMLQPLVKACKKWGFPVDISNGRALNESLDKIVLKDNPGFNKIVRMLTTRCLTQAVYTLPSAEITEKQLGHFGLAAPLYTHFTSPIRRYADVVVHRLLAAALSINSLPDLIKDKDSMKLVVDNMNLRHRNAQLASRASTQIWSLAYFAKQPHPVQQKAIILDVKPTNVRVIAVELGVECTIPLGQRGEENSDVVFDEENLILNYKGKPYTVFQSVMIRIEVRTDNLRRQKLVVTLLDDDAKVVDPVVFPQPK